MNSKLKPFALIFIVTLTLRQADATPPPQSIGAIGDSATAGTLAQFERAKVQNPFNHLPILGNFTKLLLTFDKNQIGEPEFSWSTGLDKKQKVLSHAWQLKGLSPNLKRINVAVPGAKSDQVFEQLPALQKWSRENLQQNYPDYITFMAGANDICADTVYQIPEAKHYRANVERIFSEILRTERRSHILALALPRFDSLREQVGDAKLLGVLGVGIISSCKELWRMTPICKTLTHPKTDAEQALLTQRLGEYNAALRDLASNLRKKFGDRIRVSSAIQNRVIHADDVSVDCFHPIARMQDEVARSTFKDSWWGR